MAISITKKTSTSKTTPSSNRSLSYIVIHYTAGVSSKKGMAANIASYFATSSAQASADFIVDDSTIIQYNPDLKSRYCWHCGDSKNYSKGGSFYGVVKNYNSIGIEICSTNSTGKITNPNTSSWSFTEAAQANAVELVKYLMATYGISTSNVIRHYDVSGKLCPGIYGWNADSGSEANWNAFKARLTGASSTNTSATQSTNTASYSTYPISNGKCTVKTSGATLNCRKEPNGAVVGSFANGTSLYCTAGSNNGWFYVSNGSIKGWVSGTYLKYVSGIAACQNVSEATAKLNADGVMNTPSYWVENAPKLQYLDTLLIKMANVTKKSTSGTSITNVISATNKLVSCGIINTPEYWVKNCGKVQYLDKLLMQVANRL